MNRLRYLWQRQPVVLSAFLLTAAIALFFALRFLTGAIYWSGHQKEAVKGWMTIGYVARSWGLKGPDIDSLAGLPGPKIKGHAQSLREIATDRGVPEAEVIATVEKAVAELSAKAKQP